MDYNLLLIPFIALILTQIIKIVIDSIRGKFSFRNFNDYGGMPSAHSALVTALAAEVAQTSGYNSIGFALAIVLVFLVLRDAAGFRFALGNHSKIINQLVKDLPDYKEGKYPILTERMGHTPLQVVIGAAIGIVVAIIL